MRKVAHVDGNHAEIVRELRKLCTVQSLAAVGNGTPDLLVGFRGVNVLLEIKNPLAARGPAQGLALTADEKKWHATWAGTVYVVTTAKEAMRVVVEAARPHEGMECLQAAGIV